MKHLQFLLLFAACILLVMGCAPGGSEVEKVAAEEDSAGELTGQPPEDVPDREADPVGHWTWRVEQLFLNRDADQDGRISRDEFEGNPTEFDVMDTDKDGYLSKEEVTDHVLARYMELPVSSVD